MSMIKQFFNEKVILVSGATGFLGKVLLYKLLASIPLVKKIYLLIRYKAHVLFRKGKAHLKEYSLTSFELQYLIN